MLNIRAPFALIHLFIRFGISYIDQIPKTIERLSTIIKNIAIFISTTPSSVVHEYYKQVNISYFRLRE